MTRRFQNETSFFGSHLENPSSKSLEAWFLGSKAENQDELESLIIEALRDHAFWRRNFHPGDPTQIPEETKRSEEFLQTIDHTRNSLRELLSWLKKSTPFFSLRYQGHMNWETTMPAMVGYLAAMLYNPNNVAFEASTVTTLLEVEIGKDLCNMLGLETKSATDKTSTIIRPWGHITGGGSVANLESLWAARNLKYYAFTLQHLIQNHPDLYPARELTIALANKTKKRLIDASDWELLNLDADTVLGIASQISHHYEIEEKDLQSAINNSEFTIQKMGFNRFRRKFFDSLNNDCIFLVPGTKHYSWDKSAAILGIGSSQMKDIGLDINGRMCMKNLRKTLEECLENRIPIYSTIAVIGSTEESNVDPLADIIELRDEFREHGLNFCVHADAAWGGYHTCFLHKTSESEEWSQKSKGEQLLEFGVGLSTHSQRHLSALKEADTITVDPHKSGYIPYPAGALCYRNSLMRELLTFIAPYINHTSEEPNVSSYGVEGSKAGAAVASVYLSHKVIRPDQSGYGRLIGRAMLGCKRIYSRLLCMQNDNDRFICVPLPQLSPNIPGSSPEDKKVFVRDRIAYKGLREIAIDDEAIAALQELGPDQNILCYAFNFKNADGTINNNIQKMNTLNSQIYQHLSINPGSDIYSYKLIVSTTDLDIKHYGHSFIQDLKIRLGVENSEGDCITVLRSTIMDPWMGNPKGDQFIDFFEQELRNAIAQSLLENSMLDTFLDIDIDGNDTISMDEVTTILKKLGYNEDDSKQICSTCDQDADGYLSYGEFKTHLLPYIFGKKV